MAAGNISNYLHANEARNNMAISQHHQQCCPDCSTESRAVVNVENKRRWIPGRQLLMGCPVDEELASGAGESWFVALKGSLPIIFSDPRIYTMLVKQLYSLSSFGTKQGCFPIIVDTVDSRTLNYCNQWSKLEKSSH
jgi:hypothetical protein